MTLRALSPTASATAPAVANSTASRSSTHDHHHEPPAIPPASPASTSKDAPSDEVLEPITVKASRHKARFVHWMESTWPDSPPAGRSPLAGSRTALPAQNGVATVVARIAFLELDAEREGQLTLKFLRRSFVHDARFREVLLPLLSLPCFTAQLYLDANRQWESMLQTMVLSMDGGCGVCEGNEGAVDLPTFVAFFARASSSAMRTLSPRRPSPRHRSKVEGFVRQRVDPNVQSACLWTLPTARGVQPIGAPLAASRSLPQLQARSPCPPPLSLSPQAPPALQRTTSHGTVERLPSIVNSEASERRLVRAAQRRCKLQAMLVPDEP